MLLHGQATTGFLLVESDIGEGGASRSSRNSHRRSHSSCDVFELNAGIQVFHKVFRQQQLRLFLGKTEAVHAVRVALQSTLATVQTLRGDLLLLLLLFDLVRVKVKQGSCGFLGKAEGSHLVIGAQLTAQQSLLPRVEGLVVVSGGGVHGDG